MRTNKILILIAAMMLLLMFSCDNLMNELDSSSSDAQPSEEIAPEGTSKVNLTFPMITPSLLDSLSQSTTVPSKAYLFVKYAEIIVTDAQGAQVHQSVLDPVGSPDFTDFGSALSESFYIPWGSGYTVTVDIFDTDGGALLVSGSSSLDVGFDTVNLTIALTPDSPAALAGTPYSGAMETSVYSTSASEMTSLGGEAWFSYDAAADEDMLIQLVSDSGDSAGALYLADSDGLMIGGGMTLSSSYGVPAYASIASGSSAASYYIGMGLIQYDTASQTDSYTLRCAPQTGTIVEINISDDLAVGNSPVTAAITNGATTVASAAGTLSSGSATLTALAEGSNALWEGAAGTYELSLFVDGDTDYTYQTSLSLSGSGRQVENLQLSDMSAPVQTVNLTYDSGWDGVTFTMGVYADGTLFNDSIVDTPLALFQGDMGSGNLAAELEDEATGGEWTGNGNYMLGIHADVNGNDIFDDGDEYYYAQVTLTDPPADNITVERSDVTVLSGFDPYGIVVEYDASFAGSNVFAAVFTDGTSLFQAVASFQTAALAFGMDTFDSTENAGIALLDSGSNWSWYTPGEYEVGIVVDNDNSGTPTAGDSLYFGALTVEADANYTYFASSLFTTF